MIAGRPPAECPSPGRRPLADRPVGSAVRRRGPPSTAVPANGPCLEWTGIAFGTALLAGTSSFGRRGGIFGTLLATAGMAMFLDYVTRKDLNISLYAIGACAIGGGLIVTRLVETYGKPLTAGVVGDDWNAAPASTATNWNPELPDSWTPTVSNQARPDRWEDGPWAGSR